MSSKVIGNFPVIFRHGAGYDEIKLGSLKNRHEEQITVKSGARNSAVTYRESDRKLWGLEVTTECLLFLLFKSNLEQSKSLGELRMRHGGMRAGLSMQQRNGV